MDSSDKIAAVHKYVEAFEKQSLDIIREIYAEDARQRMIFLRNEMAEHEFGVAEFYFDRGAMLAAINRVKFLIEHYDGAPVVGDALALMARAYETIGMPDLAADTRRILAHNLPDHSALSAAEE